MSSALTAFFKAHLADFRQGRTDRMSTRYSLPLVLDLRGDTRVLPRRQDIADALDRARQEFDETTLRGSRIGFCRPTERETHVKVEIRYQSIASVPTLDLTYFLSRRQGRILIEMIEMRSRNPVERWYRAFSLLPGNTWKTQGSGPLH